MSIDCSGHCEWIVCEVETNKDHLDRFLVRLLVNFEIFQLQTLCPIPFVQIHKHGLFKFRFTVIHSNRVVMSVETVDEGLN